MKNLKLAFLVFLLSVLACGQQLVDYPEDAAAPMDAGEDAPMDAGEDAPMDAGHDAAPMDAPVDAPPDAPVDAPPDAPVDAPPDAPVDAPSDAPMGIPPVVLSTNPMNAARGVALDRAASATFSVQMAPATIDAMTFTLAQGAMPMAGVVTYAGTTATFTPASDYPAGVVLTATITTGARDLNGDGLLQEYVWSFQTGTQVGQGAVPLGAASSYAILAFNTVTNVNNPGTIVTGDLGISPGAALVGFPPGLVIGTIHAGDMLAAAAKAALLAAYNDAAGRLNPAVLPGDLSGLTFTPGLYNNATSVMLAAGNFTLDAQGDSDGVFIFQIGSTLTTIGGTQVILSGGAKATNVYWAVGTSATLGTTSIFKGTVLAASAITMDTGGAIEGRLLAQGAAIALDTNIVTVPAP